MKLSKPGNTDQGVTWKKAGLTLQYSRMKSFIPELIAFLVPFILYARTITYGFLLDDHGVLVQNRFVRQGIAGIPDILTQSYRAGVNITGDNLYRPLSQVMFSIEWNLIPGNPAIHHMMNVLVYAITCLLLYKLLKKLMPVVSHLVLLVTVLLFAVHPIHTEVVAYIKSRDEIMSLFFLVIAFTLFHSWLTESLILNLCAAMIAFFLALMSKEGVIPIVAVFPLIAWFFSSARFRKILTGSFFMVIPAVLYIMVRHHVLSENPQIFTIAPVDNYLVMAPDWITRIATSVMILGKYLSLLIFPHPLVSDYSYAQLSFAGWSSPGFYVSALIYVSFILIILLRIRRKEPMVFGLAFFLIGLTIYSNLFILIGTAFGERLMYVPSVGMCIVIVFILKVLLPGSNEEAKKNNERAIGHNRYLLGAAGVIILLFVIKSIDRSGDWKTSESLITKDVETNPKSARLHLQMGNHYRDKARYSTDPDFRHFCIRKSLEEYTISLSILPSFEDAQEQAGLAWFLLGFPDTGELYLKMVLKKNPLRQDAWNNLGNIYTSTGKTEDALEAFQKAIAIDPWFGDAWRNTGSILGMMGKYEDAVSCFLKAWELNPNDIQACQFLGLTYKNMGKITESNAWQEKANELMKTPVIQ